MEEKGNKEKEESKKDYVSRRLVELKNSEQQFINNLNRAEATLEQAKANLIACRARINEIERIIEEENSPDLSKKP